MTAAMVPSGGAPADAAAPSGGGSNGCNTHAGLPVPPSPQPTLDTSAPPQPQYVPQPPVQAAPQRALTAPPAGRPPFAVHLPPPPPFTLLQKYRRGSRDGGGKAALQLQRLRWDSAMRSARRIQPTGPPNYAVRSTVRFGSRFARESPRDGSSDTALTDAAAALPPRPLSAAAARAPTRGDYSEYLPPPRPASAAAVRAADSAGGGGGGQLSGLLDGPPAWALAPAPPLPREVAAVTAGGAEPAAPQPPRRPATARPVRPSIVIPSDAESSRAATPPPPPPPRGPPTAQAPAAAPPAGARDTGPAAEGDEGLGWRLIPGDPKRERDHRPLYRELTTKEDIVRYRAAVARALKAGDAARAARRMAEQPPYMGIDESPIFIGRRCLAAGPGTGRPLPQPPPPHGAWRRVFPADKVLRHSGLRPNCNHRNRTFINSQYMPPAGVATTRKRAGACRS